MILNKIAIIIQIIRQRDLNYLQVSLSYYLVFLIVGILKEVAVPSLNV